MSELHVVATESYVSVSKQHSSVSMSVAEANVTAEPGVWWIARVLVQDGHRGSGLGSRLLRKLMDTCVAQGATSITVAPGGYGADPARQIAFYERAGFVVQAEGPMVWRPGND